MSEFASRTLLARLVGFATVSRDSNLALIGFIRDYLAGLGVECELFHNPEGTKANLFATIGPKDVGGVVLSGHTDVVPVDGQAWTAEPFALSEHDGRRPWHSRHERLHRVSAGSGTRISPNRCACRCTWHFHMTKRSAAWVYARCSQRSNNASTNRGCA